MKTLQIEIRDDFGGISMGSLIYDGVKVQIAMLTVDYYALIRAGLFTGKAIADGNFDMTKAFVECSKEDAL